MRFLWAITGVYIPNATFSKSVSILNRQHAVHKAIVRAERQTIASSKSSDVDVQSCGVHGRRIQECRLSVVSRRVCVHRTVGNKTVSRKSDTWRLGNVGPIPRNKCHLAVRVCGRNCCFWTLSSFRGTTHEIRLPASLLQVLAAAGKGGIGRIVSVSRCILLYLLKRQMQATRQEAPNADAPRAMPTSAPIPGGLTRP